MNNTDTLRELNKAVPITPENEGISSLYSKRIKPIFSLIIVMIALIPSVVIILIASICIKIESSGPVFYTQNRLGQNGKVFRIYKLRSMIVNAENDTGPIWTKENDPRITKVGKIIRKLRIDELPQLLNVFLGEMAIVGPRPERPELTEVFEIQYPGFKKRLKVKPGLTGLAQVNGGYELTPLEKLGYDLDYISKVCSREDFIILMSTFKIVITGFGSR